jgi:hypothetical protein
MFDSSKFDNHFRLSLFCVKFNIIKLNKVEHNPGGYNKKINFGPIKISQTYLLILIMFNLF